MYWLETKHIQEVKELERKTPLGNLLIEITFEDGSKDTIPKMMYDRLVSLKSKDVNEFSHLRAAIMTDLIFSILQEYGMKWNEFQYISMLLKTSVEKHREAADKILYQKAREDVTLLDLYEILKDRKEILNSILNGGV